ncbi:CMRF35-like molecule 8 isoform X2 [Girardinichthys multiradiatus]|uniref:CMRF35-like molecule 8 isoform X2 n=1 Tax=Girardinichthys multiradiatus TaxID=208333 RepID=UPI001FAC320C|nr:CMRF35-like molecule 8 isoform X2 [Girardinichthys multiradiatus]
MRSLLLTLCCFSVMRLDASEVLEASGHVGGNVSIQCFRNWSPVNISELHSVHFCKDVCSVENTIIQMEMTSSAVTRNGKYSMELDRGDGVFTVKINQLRKADAGSYLCGMRRLFNVTYQEVSLKVVDASIVPAGSPPSPNATQQMQLNTPRGSFPSSTEASKVTVKLTPSERKRRQKEANNFTDMMVVIIVSGSLAFLVCAIIPLIFYRHWRIMAGQNKLTANKNKDACCQENVETASTQVSVGVQISEEEDHLESGADDNLQYTAVSEGLDPKTLE